MLSLQAITPEPTTSSALVSSTIRTPQLEIRARAAASTIVRGNRAGGGKTRTPRVGRMVAKGHKRTNHHGRKSTVVRCCPKADSGREFMNPRPSTTLADSFTRRFGVDPSSAVRASLRRQSSDELDDGVAHGRQAWLRRRPVDSFFPASLLRGGDAGGRRKRSSS